MKKIYLQPTIEIDLAESYRLICASPEKKVHPSAEWGDVGEYAPSIWVNERHDPTTDWPSVEIEEDTKDLWSR